MVDKNKLGSCQQIPASMQEAKDLGAQLVSKGINWTLLCQLEHKAMHLGISFSKWILG